MRCLRAVVVVVVDGVGIGVGGVGVALLVQTWLLFCGVADAGHVVVDEVVVNCGSYVVVGVDVASIVVGGVALVLRCCCRRSCRVSVFLLMSMVLSVMFLLVCLRCCDVDGVVGVYVALLLHSICSFVLCRLWFCRWW